MRPRATLVLAVCWTASAAGLAALPGADRDRLLLGASTTLPRIAAWPWRVPVSGLLVGSELPVWLLALLLGAAQVEQQVGARRAVLLLGGVHVGATAVSQAVLGARVALGLAPRALLDAADVGPSYLAVAGLVGAAVLAPTRTRRAVPLVALLAGLPELLEGVRTPDLAAVGHLSSVVLAGGGACALRRYRRRP